MIYRSFNLAIVIRLIIFGGFVVGFSISVYNHNWLTIPVFALGLIISVWNFVYFLNAINRKITFFFDSVGNDDTTLHYSENVRSKSLRDLHQSMNGLNNRISEIKIKNEHNEQFYLEMLKYSASGIMAVDADGYIEMINNSALGYIDMAHISHLSLLEQKKPELYDQMLKVRPGQTKTIKLLYGTDLRLLSLKVSSLKFGDKQYKLFTLNDIKAELEENELDSWQKLIRVMTHEIMNSIGPITSLSNILNGIYLKEGQPIPLRDVTEKHIQNTIHGLEVIEQTSRGLMHFVEDYRKLTKIPKPVFKPINIVGWLGDVELLMRNTFQEEQIEFKLVHREFNKEIIGDEKLLTQVLINLLNNSVDALKKAQHRSIKLLISEGQTGKLKISVVDNGAGIAAEEIEKIFIPFYTTKENGSGIGLSLSRQIMRLHKGSISAFSQPGENTTVVLSF
jgi:nitrogen fixation/metabolism regulation signal transduction histidine kinase